MTVDLMKEKGIDLDKQLKGWREIIGTPFSKLNDDAFTRVRAILLNGIEMEALRFQHSFARNNPELRQTLARVRRSEAFQQMMVNWLLPADQSVLETTIAYEQVAVEVTASLAEHEPDPYLAQVYRFGLLEDFDHLYRYSALMDRLTGMDANNIVQCYTDIRPGRPTAQELRYPDDDVRDHYDRNKAKPITKLNALTILAGEQQTQNYYQNFGPTFSDPAARLLYAEIASIEEQHVTQYESMTDPHETWLEKWLLHEATEAYNYYSAMQDEGNSRIRAIWETMLHWELGHFQLVADLFRKTENRDPAEVLGGGKLPEPICFASHRDFVRETLAKEVDLRAAGPRFIDVHDEKPDSRSRRYRETLNAKLSPSETVATGYCWMPGTELRQVAAEQR